MQRTKKQHTVIAATGSTKDFYYGSGGSRQTYITFFTVAVDLVGLFAEREGTIHKAPADDAE